MRFGIKDILFVSVQFLLFGLFLFNVESLNIAFSKLIKQAGTIILIAGALELILGLLHLNRNLSPFPTPKAGAYLVRTGLYKYIRHPVYSGILISGLGFSVVTGSGFRLIATSLLFILFCYKTIYEEEKLLAVFPEYSDYKKRTGRFLPKL